MVDLPKQFEGFAKTDDAGERFVQADLSAGLEGARLVVDGEEYGWEEGKVRERAR